MAGSSDGSEMDMPECSEGFDKDEGGEVPGVKVTWKGKNERKRIRKDGTRGSTGEYSRKAVTGLTLQCGRWRYMHLKLVAICH
ncbi:hypothetical protein DPEC_G00311600 [Dallia pectoralis]|uniref:Uncharacterized protein n=1 Tax=Dallia pectoralis TaxID=75939 RepID=A0ACC2FBJ0_DALPE|nr:hypothetical protein DPEC_G00311600 [Dallia pectoralis]